MIPGGAYERILRPVDAELALVQRELDRLGADDGHFLHHVIGSLLALPEERLRPGVVLLLAKAGGGIEPPLVRFAAAVQIVYAAALAHQQPHGRGEIGERDQLRVLAGDYLYAQAALITASLHQFAVMSALAAAIQTICRADAAALAQTGGAPEARVAHEMGMFRLAATGAGLLLRREGPVLLALERYGAELDAAFDQPADPGPRTDDGGVLALLQDSPARRALYQLAEAITRPAGDGRRG